MPSLLVEETLCAEKAAKVMLQLTSCKWLHEQISSDSLVILLDCRPFSEFARSHVQGAINLAIPNLMLRRLQKGGKLGNISSLLSSENAREKFAARSSAKGIVLYDSCSNDIDVAATNSTMAFLLSKFSEDEDTRKVRILEGGFKKFRDNYPSLCEGTESELLDVPLSLARIRLSDNPVANSIHDCEPHTPLLETKESSVPVEILPNLYLGSEKDASNLETLRRYNITRILNVTHDVPNTFAHLKEFKYSNLLVEDNCKENLVDFFPEAFEFIDSSRENNRSVLIHCLAGVSRSVTITIAYIMYKKSLSLNDAYDLVKDKKKNISPNFNFMGQLLEFERALNTSSPETPSSTTSTLSDTSLDDDVLDSPSST